MNALWWNKIRMQLGLKPLSPSEAIDQYLALSPGEVEEWLFQVAYGHIEGMHPFNDRDWWLSSISI